MCKLRYSMTIKEEFRRKLKDISINVNSRVNPGINTLSFIPVVCRKRRLVCDSPSDANAKTEASCQNNCGMIKIPSTLNAYTLTCFHSQVIMTVHMSETF